MKDSLNRKRRWLAWFLLFALCLQRVVGFAGGELVYVVAVEARMDETEKHIADKIKTDMGFEAHIKTLEPSRLASLHKLGYSSPFIFSEEIDGQIYYYTIDDSAVDTFHYSSSIEEQPGPHAPLNETRNPVDRLFSDFYFWEPNISIHTSPFINIRGTYRPHFKGDPFISIPSPPPWNE